MSRPCFLEMNGKWAAYRAQCGRVKANLCRKTKVCPLAPFVKAVCAMVRCTSSGCFGLGGKISLFLHDWGLARVALSCPMALDMPCWEVNEVWQWRDATERPAVTARKAFHLTVDGLSQKRRGLWCENDGEGTRVEMDRPNFFVTV